jgi:hypothetical protein
MTFPKMFMKQGVGGFLVEGKKGFGRNFMGGHDYSVGSR